MPESRKRKKDNPTTKVAAPAAPRVAGPSPSWWAPTMVTLMIVGLVWVVLTYLFRGDIPIPGIGNWNLGIGFGLVLAGFVMTMRWR